MVFQEVVPFDPGPRTVKSPNQAIRGGPNGHLEECSPYAKRAFRCEPHLVLSLWLAAFEAAHAQVWFPS